MKFHPACKIFPELEGAEFEALVEDIRMHGLREKILIDENGQILDGRNRYRACQKLGIEPASQIWRPRKDDSVIALVVSLNIARRHLTPSDRAILADKLTPMFVAEANARMLAQAERGKEGGRGHKKETPTQKVEEGFMGEAAEQAAQITGANRQYVYDVSTLREEAPELYDDVVKHKRNVKQAKQEHNNRKRAERRKANQQQIEKSAPTATLEDLIRSGAKFATITLDPPWTPDDSGIHTVYGRSEPDYATMPLDEIAALPVAELADTDCHLYLWATNRTLPLAFVLLEKWGFRYVTALVWVKPHFGMGNYFRGQHEHVLFAIRGSQPLKRKDVGTVFHASSRGEHSAKPNEFYEIVESCSHAPYFDFFGREARTNWKVWGENGLAS